MNPRDLIRDAAEDFRRAGVPDPEYDSAILLSHLCGRPPLSLRLDTDTELDEDTVHLFRKLCGRRIKREPLQYILEEAPFCGFLFYVDPRVLIPRPETELLYEWAVESLSQVLQPCVLDLCCGSGCLAISLKRRFPSASVWASDISGGALDVARQNASRLDADICFVQSDLFSSLPDVRFNLIVCNPPYIPASECHSLQPEVMREPMIALDGGDDGMAFYRRICRESPHFLTAGGSLFMELGDGESDDVSVLMRESGFSSVEIRNDYQLLPRMIRGIIT